MTSWLSVVRGRSAPARRAATTLAGPSIVPLIAFMPVRSSVYTVPWNGAAPDQPSRSIR